MSHTLAELQSMPMEQLIREHDEQAKHAIMGVNYYLDEIRRRQAKEQGDRMEQLTVRIRGLTVAIAVLTLVSTVAVVISEWQQSSAEGRRDADPTLTEARAWLRDAIPSLSRSHVGFRDAAIVVDVWTAQAMLDSACVLRLESETVVRSAGKPEQRSREVAYVPLREADANGVHATKGAAKGLASSIEDQDVVVVPIWAGRPVIVDSTFYALDTFVDQRSEARIPARDYYAAQRIAAALREAVTLCGGKVVAF